MKPLYHHDLPSIEDYLHHRPPYLLISRIESIEDRSIRTSTQITGHEGFCTGHFPGSPIVPGAIMQEMTTQTAGILIAARFNPHPPGQFNTHDPFFNEYALGVLIRVKGARFRGFARPGDALIISVELIEQQSDMFEFHGRMTVDDRTIMSNQFQLANIPSQTLQGRNTGATGSRETSAALPAQA
ncbi:MAG: 3-hydroxyacyl-ACP dehydratase FabZ family protein [Planctomycetota bacterium]